AGSVLLVRRKWPIAVVLVAVAVTPAQMGFVLGIVGLYTLAACEVPRRIIGSLAGMSLLGTLIVTFVRARQDLARGELGIGDWFVPFAAV
ncbi:sensor histidine kinase, partial [Streptomyces sp. TRM76130]|nr:sensor histidine kinase [Streptomyces sp. TRM76130]